MTLTRRQMLEDVRAAREGRVVTRHAPFAEHVCRIPESDWPVLCALFPGLDGKQGTQAHHDAMTAFHASEASAVYKVRRKFRKDNARGVIVRPPPPVISREQRAESDHETDRKIFGGPRK